jgi:hypothetical protein
VKVPGFSKALDEITRMNFADPGFLWKEAYVACPDCGKAVDLGEEHRGWVCENPQDTFVAAGYRVSPFDCSSIIHPSALVKASVDYERKQDFYNQRLGLSLEDKESSILEDEVRSLFISEYPGGGFSYVMGLDMGNMCHAVIAAVLPDGNLIVVHRERIPLFNVIERRRELARQYRVRMSVVDHGPYTETVYRMQQEDRNLFAGVYSNSKAIDLFKVKEVDEDDGKGQQGIKQVNISRDRMFDLIMSNIRGGRLLVVANDEDDLWVSHLTDQKRVREFRSDELVFVWTKTRGEDHFHHGLLYATVASQILGVSSNGARIPMLVTSFAVEPVKTLTELRNRTIISEI